MNIFSGSFIFISLFVQLILPINHFPSPQTRYSIAPLFQLRSEAELSSMSLSLDDNLPDESLSFFPGQGADKVG